MGQYKATVILLCCLLSRFTCGLELVSLPEPAMIPQGDSYTVYCETDEPYEICKWSHVDQDKNCRVTSDEIEAKQGFECIDDSHIIWDLTETRCGITIQNAARSDVGEYKCTVGVLEPEVSILTASVNIDVSVPAIVTFRGTFSDTSHVELDLNSEAVVSCHVTGGYPEPTIQAAIGHEKDQIDTDEADQILEEIGNQSNQLDDGTYEVTKTFSFIASEEHCGQYVKCEAVQTDEEGQILFQEQDVMSRKLSVVFGPQPLESDFMKPFYFVEGDRELEVNIIFAANPVPENNEAIWHINPTGNASTASHVLQAGHSEEDGKYIALPLNNTQEEGHGIRATLIITYPTVEDTENLNYLEVATSKGTQQYHFELEIIEAPLEDENGYDPKKSETEQNKAKGMGVGSVIAIVIVVAVICLIIGCVVYSKRTGKCCFERYDPVATKQPEIAVEIDNHKNIIKNGDNFVDNKLQKPEEAGIDETDEQKKENPV